MNVMDQQQGDGWTAINGDCVEALQGLPDSSVDYSIFSPPFSSLYTYSNSPRDMGNCRTDAEFFEHFGHLIAQLRAGIRQRLQDRQDVRVAELDVFIDRGVTRQDPPSDS